MKLNASENKERFALPPLHNNFLTENGFYSVYGDANGQNTLDLTVECLGVDEKS